MNDLASLAKLHWDNSRSYIQAASLRDILRCLPFLIIISSGTAVGIVYLQLVAQHDYLSERGLTIISCAGFGILIATLLFALIHTDLAHRMLDQLEDPSKSHTKAFLLSISLGILALPIPAYLAVWKSHYHFIQWYVYGFLDKRWLFALYWLCIGCVLLLPAIIYRLLVEPFELTLASEPVISTASRIRLFFEKPLVKLVLALSIACFMYGPPWNIERTGVSIDFHEQVHLGPLQAIEKGYLPNIGPAAQQYGPGTQLIMYSYMKLSNQFSLLGFRQAQSLMYFIGYCIFALTAFWVLRIEYAFLAVLLSVFISPFTVMNWTSTGGLHVWGWPNPLRYIGAYLLVLCFPFALLTEHHRWQKAMALGALYGVFCWISPENIMMGIGGVSLLLLIVWTTKTASLKRIVQTLLASIGGASISWLPILILYATADKLQEYLQNFLLVGGQVLRGFSNTPPALDLYSNPNLYAIFLFSTPYLIILGLSVLYEGARLRSPLSRTSLVVLALICTQLTNFFASLTRTDHDHFLNTLIAFPVLIASVIQYLPAFLSTTNRLVAIRYQRLLIVLTLVIALGTVSTHSLSLVNQFRDRLVRFLPNKESRAIFQAENPVWQRIGYPVNSRDAIVIFVDQQQSVSVEEFVAALTDIQTIVGNKSVYVESFPGVQPDLVYFLANLRPSNVLFNRSTMVFSEEVYHRYLAHYETIVQDIDYVVTTNVENHEVKLFRSAHPTAKVTARMLKGYRYYIIGNP